MTAYQISIFAENKPGRLAKVTGLLAKEKINIRATTISTSGDFGIINLIVDDPKRAHKVLSKGGLTVSIKDVIAVVIDDKPGGLDKLVQVLAGEDINVENAYGFVIESWKNAVFVVEVDQLEKTQEILKKKGFETLDTESLSAVEPFHYLKY